MKILHVTDLHFHAPWFSWLSEQAPKFDVVALSGDLLDLFHVKPQEEQIDWVSDWLRKARGQYVICSGNHDLDEAPECHWLRYLGTAREHLVTDRQLFRRGPWTIEAVPDFGLPMRGGENHVVVTHAPPAGAATASASGEDLDCGDPALERRLRSASDAPWIVLSGHVHRPVSWYSRRAGTWSFNPGSLGDADYAVPNHIVLDLEQATATWRNGFGRHETVRLR